MQPLKAGSDMEGQKLALQNRPEFVPKQPPRRRQRGALTQLDNGVCRPVNANDRFSVQAKEFTSTPATTSYSCSKEQRSNPSLFVNFEMSSRQNPASAGLLSIEKVAAQIVLPQPNGSRAKRQNTGHQPNGHQPRDFVRGAVHRRWQRDSTQGGQPHQISPIMPTDGHAYLSNQRGTMPASQGQILPVLTQQSRTLSSFLATKASFDRMWHQLEIDIQCREEMLMGMRDEMEKCATLLKISKLDALKEKEEAEASRAAALETSAAINKQTQSVKSVRQHLELISTDLSVQVAELNLLMQQVQEQQRIVELFEHLKEHYDATDNVNRIQMDKRLQVCEEKLAMMEKELALCKMGSKSLEKAVSEKVGNLEDIEAGGMLESVYMNTDANKIVDRMQAPGLHEFEKLLKNAVYKPPKMEPS